MKRIISNMLDSYENGRMTRRQLIQGLAVIAAGTHALPAAGSPFQGREINHLALNVTNVQRSRDFYQKLLGMPVLRESSTSCFLGLGRNFLALFQNQKPEMNQYCIAIENYEVSAVTEELKRQGLNPNQPEGTNRVYFRDPDGLEVQLSAVDHRPQ